MKKILSIVFILLVSASLLAGEPNKLLANLPAQDLYGNKIVYNKDLYLLDVWATWCPPCQMTIPELVAVQQKFASANFTVIGLSVDTEGPKTVKDFIEEQRVNYPVAMAGKSLNYLPAVRGIPTMFLVNREGKIVGQFIGYTDHKVLSETIAKKLQKKN